ncbi:MAG TPA: heme-binding domain-containing protein [bacterium]|jgi:cytochrome c551/c552|nr:heme-binding domain-containing protein [bacterium]
MKKFWIVTAVVLCAFAALAVLRPRPGGRPMRPAPLGKLDPKALARVSASYEKDIKPLFQRACFDCHTTKTVWPWYHAIPGVKQYLDHHVAEGDRGLDLTNGVPFGSDDHDPMDHHLWHIGRMVASGKMPLWDYALMHPDARLTDAERQTIVRWTQDSFADLSTTAGPAPSAPEGGGMDHDHGEHHD